MRVLVACPVQYGNDYKFKNLSHDLTRSVVIGI